MKIIPLNCPNCGTRLEIGENKEQLACGTCGSQLFVDRSGGAISLELSKSLGAISTGAVQTAAELALVRLEKELGSASYEVIRLESEIAGNTSALPNYSFKEQDIMNEKGFTSANDRLGNLKADLEGQWGESFLQIFTISLVIVCIIAAIQYGQGSWLSVLVMLIPFGIVAFIFWCIIGGIFLMISISRSSQLDKSLKAVENQIARHQLAAANREAREKATITISQANEKLPDARALVARIEAEIARNKKIVSGKS